MSLHHPHAHHHPSDLARELGDDGRLAVAQIVVGWLAHSQALIAHGLHSFSDRAGPH